MDEGRLAAVKKSRDYNRKFVYVMNDIAKNRQEIYESCLSQEMAESKSKLMSELQVTRKAMVRSKILLQCLRAGRKQWGSPNSLSPFGAYGGRPIGAFARDIEQTIAWNSPRLKRLRQVERIKDSCLKHGAILDSGTVRTRMNHFFTESIEKPAAAAAGRLQARQTRPSRETMEDHQTDIFHSNLRYRPPRRPGPRDLPDPVSASGVSLQINPYGRLVGISKTGDGQDDELTDEPIQDSEGLQEGWEDPSAHREEDSRTTMSVADSENKEDLLHGTRYAPLPPISNSPVSRTGPNQSPPDVGKSKQSKRDRHSVPQRTLSSDKHSSSESKVKSNEKTKPPAQSSEKTNTKLKFSNKSKDGDQDGGQMDTHFNSLDGQCSDRSDNPDSSSQHRPQAPEKGPTTTTSEGPTHRQLSPVLENENSSLRRAPTLILPPIKSKKSDIKESKQSQQKSRA